jgi:hypothetical protein
MSEKIRIRQSIVLHLDVMISDESEDYLEVEITHPKLSGALYLTVNDRKEAEETMSKIDASEQEDEEATAKLKTFFSSPSSTPSVIALPASPSYSSTSSSVTAPTVARQIGPTKVSTAPVDSLVRNSVSLAGGLLDFAAGIKKLRKR